MGNAKSCHKLYCEGCNDNYDSIGDATWNTIGTVSRYPGYCPNCCGGSTRTWTYTGNVVLLKCEDCSSTYGVITWDDWRNSSYDTIGFCSSCYNSNQVGSNIEDIIESMASLMNVLSINVMPSVPARYINLYSSVAYTRDNNLTTKFYDYEFKQDNSDEIKFTLERQYVNLYTMDSPNSITLNFKDTHEDNSITIEFGTKGSNVHIAVSLDTYENQKGFRSVYHFGVLLSGNTYTVKDNKKGTVSVKHYCMIHLIQDHIIFMLCKSYKRAMAELNSVWPSRSGTKHGQISHYHKIIGHSILSARIICAFLVKEQDQGKIPYHFKGLKDHHNSLQIWFPDNDLAKITNCFLFVIRFAKLLNKAHTKEIEIPSADDIVRWTIGKQEWHNTDIFNHVWDHGKSVAEP